VNVIMNEFYLNRVERTMEKLRAACLGQDTYLSAVLPPHLLTGSTEQQAAHLARQIVFALAAAHDTGAAESYQRSYEWLYGTVLFLLRECNRVDQTFFEMIRLMKLSHGVREMLFDEKKESSTDYKAIREDGNMPEPLEEIDTAILCLLESTKLDARVAQWHTKVEDLLKDL